MPLQYCQSQEKQCCQHAHTTCFTHTSTHDLVYVLLFAASNADTTALRPEIASGIRGIRNESGRERLNATTMLAYKYRQWTDSTAASDAATHMLQAEVRAAVMDDLLWMVRYGEPELQVCVSSAQQR